MLRYLESVFGFEKPRDAFQSTGGRDKDRLFTAYGVSYKRLFFHGTSHTCLFSRGPSLTTFPICIQVVLTRCPGWDLGEPYHLNPLMGECLG